VDCSTENSSLGKGEEVGGEGGNKKGGKGAYGLISTGPLRDGDESRTNFGVNCEVACWRGGKSKGGKKGGCKRNLNRVHFRGHGSQRCEEGGGRKINWAGRCGGGKCKRRELRKEGKGFYVASGPFLLMATGKGATKAFHPKPTVKKTGTIST